MARLRRRESANQVSVAFCQSGKGPGDIRSENADMSNDESCEKHERLPPVPGPGRDGVTHYSYGEAR